MRWAGRDGPDGDGWRPLWSLLLVSAVTAAVQLIGSYYAGVHQGQRLTPLAVALLLTGPVALLGRRRWPAGVLVLTTVAGVLYYGLGFPYGPAFVSFAVAAMAAVLAGHRLLGWVSALAGVLTYFLLHQVVVGGPPPAWTSMVGHVAAVTVMVAVADLVRNHRQTIAEQRRNRLEHERRRASEERLRIAQELHDVLAHNISLITVQAGVALHLMDQQPEQARTALTTIRHASKEALSEMRSALAVLRGDGYAPRTPTPGLDRLDELTGRLSDSGLPVRTTVTGAPRDLPVGVDLAAYRIVQEALTNVYRHAGASRATVQLEYGERSLAVTVTDDGRGGGHRPDLSGAADGRAPRDGRTSGDDSAPGDGAGHGGASGGSGIPGMRERATALGGSLSAGPAPDGGFRVTARLPLDGEVG
ncbi:MAG: sensor histidine kinase [Actinocatenispora sp.]